MMNLREIFKPLHGGWAHLFKEHKSLMLNILKELDKEKNVIPKLSDIFFSFIINPNHIKKVIIGQNIYPTRKNVKYSTEEAIKLLYEGVFFIDYSLTTVEGIDNKHRDLWEPFVEIIIKNIKIPMTYLTSDLSNITSNNYDIYTDGALGSYGIYVDGLLNCYGKVKPHKYIYENGDITIDENTYYAPTTQRGEYLAICYALLLLKKLKLNSKLITDSFNSKGILVDWTKKRDSKYKNPDLVIIMRTLYKEIQNEIVHTLSHNKDPYSIYNKGNNIADKLAEKGKKLNDFDINIDYLNCDLELSI